MFAHPATKALLAFVLCFASWVIYPGGECAFDSMTMCTGGLTNFL